MKMAFSRYKLCLHPINTLNVASSQITKKRYFEMIRKRYLEVAAVCVPCPSRTENKIYFFFGIYQRYFMEYVENISHFTVHCVDDISDMHTREIADIAPVKLLIFSTQSIKYISYLYPRFEKVGGILVYICPWFRPSFRPSFRNSVTLFRQRYLHNHFR